MYTCVKNGKTFQVKGSKAAKLYEAAGYTVTEKAETKAKVETKAKAKTKAKAAEDTETAEEA
ncbi:MAG: hypothetical protein LUC87_00640 [Clostridiales bacterium]|nr:hypothetical protein [Clostridiales bacterium]